MPGGENRGNERAGRDPERRAGRAERADGDRLRRARPAAGDLGLDGPHQLRAQSREIRRRGRSAVQPRHRRARARCRSHRAGLAERKAGGTSSESSARCRGDAPGDPRRPPPRRRTRGRSSRRAGPPPADAPAPRGAARSREAARGEPGAAGHAPSLRAPQRASLLARPRAGSARRGRRPAAERTPRAAPGSAVAPSS